MKVKSQQRSGVASSIGQKNRQNCSPKASSFRRKDTFARSLLYKIAYSFQKLSTFVFGIDTLPLRWPMLAIVQLRAVVRNTVSFYTPRIRTMTGIDFTNRKHFEVLEKLPKPSNENLKKLFSGIDTIVIKDNGVLNGKALSDTVLLTISIQDNIKKFADTIKINEANTGFYCLCLGTYAIELISNSEIKSTIGFHHGTSIRFDEWNGDAELAETDSFLELLSDLGFEKPLHDKLEGKRNMEADRVAERKWLDIAPRCFAKYWAEIKSLDDSFLPQLLEELNIEIPDKQKQIITLLQTFGRTENFWTYYPNYEEAPNAVLKTFDLADIINAYLNSDRNYKTRKGLGRFLCSSDLKKIRKKYITHITDEVISDLEKCFSYIGEKQGIGEILKLKNEKKKG